MSNNSPPPSRKGMPWSIWFLIFWAWIINHITIPFRRYYPGTFNFKDGTVQGWTLDQLYDTNTGGPQQPQQKVQSYTPGNPPTYTIYEPFQLLNHLNIALEAYAPFYLVSDNNVNSCDIYLESPDLSQDQNWQNIVGYSIDVQREFYFQAGDAPKSYFAQLQLQLIDTTDNSDHLFSEIDPSGTPQFHELKLMVPYHFVWKPSILADPKYKMKQVRIRFTMPGWTSSSEFKYMGSWKITNVCPLK